jgi:hypothetical protein
MKFDRPKTIKYTAHSNERATVVTVLVFLGLDSQKIFSFSKTAFLEGIKKFKKSVNKCIDQGGMYFEE